MSSFSNFSTDFVMTWPVWWRWPSCERCIHHELTCEYATSHIASASPSVSVSESLIRFDQVSDDTIKAGFSSAAPLKITRITADASFLHFDNPRNPQWAHYHKSMVNRCPFARFLSPFVLLHSQRGHVYAGGCRLAETIRAQRRKLLRVPKAATVFWLLAHHLLNASTPQPTSSATFRTLSICILTPASTKSNQKMEAKKSRAQRRATNKKKRSEQQIAQRSADRFLARVERSPDEQNLKSLRQHLKKAKQHLRKAIRENRGNEFIQEKERIVADFESRLNIAESGSV